MKLKVVGILFLTFVIAYQAFPILRPRDIALDADFENNQLYIKIENFVSNPKKGYIWKVEIVVDQRPPIIENFFFQKRGYYKEFVVDLEDLENVSKVKIKSYRKGGGSLEREFDIQKLKDEALGRKIHF